MISVVIRNKNQSVALSFLLKNLTERYAKDVAEIIVVDNLSTDSSKEISKKFGARFVSIENFSFGGSANVCAREAQFPIVVIFSAHSYPVSHDFFSLIQAKFDGNPNLAGLRCLHSTNDYKNFINKTPATIDPNKSGLIFSGSAFSRAVWEKHPFREDVATFEDKEWTTRVLKVGYAIDFVESIFCYEIKRTRKQLFFRFKNDVIGNYQLWHEEIRIGSTIKGFLSGIFYLMKSFVLDLWYILLRFLYLIKFRCNKPNKF
ncbi:glycosyltransferase [Flavobacterium algoritolerans]|uniref:Glycosyltransferase n=1 Tax=Flavobacterium algoritolerans TaxID=3041254 RepID=A0ABT6VBF5_9FLAO|nr:glycosyltransferase [Flavobacterium algoritolerans]MDI5895575.1 glycosyltransferase [Flavobacterium algoritolerans]